MTEIDDRLIQQFFTDNRKEIEDNGFSRRVMRSLPNRAQRIAQAWALFCSTLAIVLFFALDGLELLFGTLRETFTTAAHGGITDVDPKSLVIVGCVLLFFVYRKVCSLAV